MNGPLAVMGVIAAETAVGGAALTWALGAWGHARRGFFLLMGVLVTLLTWGSWAAVRVGLPSPDGVGSAVLAPSTVLLATAVLLTASCVLLVARRDMSGRAVGLLATVVGIGGLVSLAGAREFSFAVGVGEVLLGAFFLGSALYALVLGHWYLFERQLDKRHMVRGAVAYAAGCLAAAGSAVLSATNPAPSLGGFSPFLAIPGFSLYLAAGLIAVCALIAGFGWKLATEGGRSIQAGTGLFYLAVIMAFSAELSAKVRFFGLG